MFFQNIFSERLKSLRLAKNLKQSDIAALLDVSITQISDIERGRRSTTIENLVVLADYFNTPTDFLVGRSKYLQKGEPYMDISNVSELFETTDVGQANEYINAGWQLIETAKAIGSADMQISSYILYCLGWDTSKGEVVHPISHKEQPVKIIDDNLRSN